MITAPKNHRLFIREFIDSFETTGALLPSGPALCRVLASSMKDRQHPRRLLEIGAGTGVVTDAIIRRMGPDDTLDLVELNDRFAAALRARLDADPRWREVAPRLTVHHLPVQEFVPSAPYDAIVSGVPFNNFPVELVEEILQKLAAMAGPAATLSFYEYAAVRRLKSAASGRAERARLSGVGRVIRDARSRWGVGSKLVLANVPPAWVHCLQFD